MSEYTPDSWHIVEIKSPKYGTIYKVLCSWYGGFTQGDSWKMSSGIKSVTKEGKLYTMPQASGSVYICQEGGEHMSSLMGGVLDNFRRNYEGQPDVSFTVIPMDEYLEKVKV